MERHTVNVVQSMEQVNEALLKLKKSSTLDYPIRLAAASENLRSAVLEFSRSTKRYMASRPSDTAQLSYLKDSIFNMGSYVDKHVCMLLNDWTRMDMSSSLFSSPQFSEEFQHGVQVCRDILLLLESVYITVDRYIKSSGYSVPS